MRSYGQYCSIARALDVVGERWMLLIVRELLLQGPCRFTDLKNGLPGIAPNLLSNRLKELEDAGLISRGDAPPPVATALYALTSNGLALEPVLKALGTWGLQFMVVEHDDDVFQAHWLAYAASWFAADPGPDAPPMLIQLLSSGKAAVIDVGRGAVQARVGRTPTPDLTLEGPPRSILGLLTGMIDPEQATEMGLTATGDAEMLTRLHSLRGTVNRAGADGRSLR